MPSVQDQLPADTAPLPAQNGDETPSPVAPQKTTVAGQWRKPDYFWLNRRRLGTALLLSLLLHGGMLALQFGAPGNDLPWFELNAPERHGIAEDTSPAQPPQPQQRTRVSLRRLPAPAAAAPHQPAAAVSRPTAKPKPAPARLQQTLDAPVPVAAGDITAVAHEPPADPEPEIVAEPAPPLAAAPEVIASTEPSSWSIPAPQPPIESVPESAPPPVVEPVKPTTEPDRHQAEIKLAREREEQQLRESEREREAASVRDAELRRLAAAQRADTERQQAAEAARHEAERVRIQQIEAQRVEAQRVEAQRIEAERLAAERAEQQRRERLAQLEAQHAAQMEAQQRAESDRQAELARIEREHQRAADEARIAAVASRAAEKAAADAAAAAASEQAARAEASRLASGRIGGSDPSPAVPAGNELARSALDSIRNRRPASADFDFMAQQPRRGSILGSQSRDVQMNFYADAWQQKVERFARLNAPRLGRNRYYEPMRVVTSINSDGTLANITIISGSGDPGIDDAVRRIIVMAAPYAAFPPPLKRAYDTIDIRRTWVVLDDQLRLTQD